ncbi:hypothetical protein E2C01_043825 [Portunus trituberculatus]|uniref:Uncharacterized protein n=1 Tax=Portunus trituberculatus TaxID=210409 RepID=A0A5B7FX60_PORTR|nr:hypothetical protein [Portunus trituberculatus]
MRFLSSTIQLVCSPLCVTYGARFLHGERLPGPLLLVFTRSQYVFTRSPIHTHTAAKFSRPLSFTHHGPPTSSSLRRYRRRLQPSYPLLVAAANTAAMLHQCLGTANASRLTRYMASSSQFPHRR